MKAILFVILNVSVCFPRGSVGVEILIPGGFGGWTKKIFQARYRSPWPPPRNTALIFTLHSTVHCSSPAWKRRCCTRLSGRRRQSVDCARGAELECGSCRPLQRFSRGSRTAGKLLWKSQNMRTDNPEINYPTTPAKYHSVMDDGIVTVLQ